MSTIKDAINRCVKDYGLTDAEDVYMSLLYEWNIYISRQTFNYEWRHKNDRTTSLQVGKRV